MDEVPRKEDRKGVLLFGYVRANGQPVEPAEFEDVSSGGCCIRGEFGIGDIIAVTVPGVGTVEAQVRWSIGGRSGLRFLLRGTEPASASEDPLPPPPDS